MARHPKPPYRRWERLKLLWGKTESRAVGRSDLRAQLGVDDTSPLRDWALRNHFEHFDQRLEDRMAECPDYIGRNIGSWTADADRYQHFDPATGIVTFWRDAFSLADVATELRRIYVISCADVLGQ